MHGTETERATERSQTIIKAASTVVAGMGRRPNSGHDGPDALMPVIAKTKGATVTDVDGNEYVDFDCAAGTAILGHADDRLMAAVTKAAAKGLTLPSPSEAEVRLAELVVSRFPAAESMCLTSSRAEAVRLAVELAKARTRRPQTVVCRIAEKAEQGTVVPDRRYGLDALVAPFNDAKNAGDLLNERARDIAAVVVEPLATWPGLHAPGDLLLARLRAACDEHGCALIFDETVTGVRLGSGGAAAHFGVRPDLVCLGGSFAAGFPMGLVGGGRDWMLPAAEILGPSSQPPGGELPIVAATAILQATAEAGFFEGLADLAASLQKGLSEGAAGIDAEIVCASSMVGVTFSGPLSGSGLRRTDRHAKRHAALRARMLDAGFHVPRCLDQPWYVCAAHTPETIAAFVSAFTQAVRELS